MALDGVKQMVLDVDVPALAPQQRENLPRQIFTAGMDVVVDLAELPREITCRHLPPGIPSCWMGAVETRRSAGCATRSGTRRTTGST